MLTWHEIYSLYCTATNQAATDTNPALQTIHQNTCLAESLRLPRQIHHLHQHHMLPGVLPDRSRTNKYLV